MSESQYNHRDWPALTLAAVRAYLAGGLSVVPIEPDGSKRPAGGSWKKFQRRLAVESEVMEFWGNGTGYGVGIVGGKVSGHLEHLDFDKHAATIFPAWCDLVEAEAPGLADRLSIRQTPSGGYHASYRCPEVEIPGNTKLAMEANPDFDPKKPRGKDNPETETLIETRGEGGQVLAPGCPPACHPTGRTYEHVRGPKLSHVQAITAAEREVLLRAAQSFDRQVVADDPPAASGPMPGKRPGDDYCERGPDWSEILGPAGWVQVRQSGAVRYWRRPGKDGPGWSATTGACTSKSGWDLLAVFSSNAAPFPGPGAGRTCSAHNKFSAYALLSYGGDFSAAAKELARQGYGDRKGGRKPDGKDGSDAEEVKPSGYELILAEFRERYSPTFRRDLALYSGRLNRLIKSTEACLAPGKALAEKLTEARDVPRDPEGRAKRNAIPQFFRTWAPSAWFDLVNSLRDEEEAEEVADGAQEQFRAQVISALLSFHSFSYTHRKSDGEERTEVQRRTLLNWCDLWAKPGQWQGIRGMALWARRDKAGSLRIALHKNLFAQRSRSIDMTQKRFVQLAENYGVGRRTDERPGGSRAIELAPEFLAELMASPQIDGLTENSSHARVRENDRQSVNPERKTP